MSKAIEKYWYAVGFWHAKIQQHTPPTIEEIEYIKEVTDRRIDISQEYEKGYKAGLR